MALEPGGRVHQTAWTPPPCLYQAERSTQMVQTVRVCSWQTKESGPATQLMQTEAPANEYLPSSGAKTGQGRAVFCG